MSSLLSGVFTPQTIKTDMESRTKKEAFEELVNVIAELNPEYNRDEMLAAIWKREEKMNTDFESGVAVPHAFCPGLTKAVGAIGISKPGIDYGSHDNRPVNVVFMVVMGEPVSEGHLRILSQISQLIQSDALVHIKEAKNAEEVDGILSTLNY